MINFARKNESSTFKSCTQMRTAYKINDKFNTRIKETFPEVIAICEARLNDDVGKQSNAKNLHDYQEGQESRKRRWSLYNGSSRVKF